MKSCKIQREVIKVKNTSKIFTWIILKYLCSCFYWSKHCSILWQESLIFTFRQWDSIWLPRLMHYAETAAHSAYERNIFARFTRTWRNLRVRNWSRNAALRRFPRVFLQREREKQNRKCKLNWEYVYEGIFTRPKAENCDRGEKLCLNLSWYKNTG